jgi:hypothetical protein
VGETEYERGLRDGEVRALAEAVGRAHLRLDLHDKRLGVQERITYSLLGALMLIEFAPALQKFLG